MTTRPHLCDDQCICPVHRTPLIYWPYGDDHACQDVTCEYGHGMTPCPVSLGPYAPILPVPVDSDGGERPQPGNEATHCWFPEIHECDHRWLRLPIVNFSATYQCRGCETALQISWLAAAGGTLGDLDRTFEAKYGGRVVA